MDGQSKEVELEETEKIPEKESPVQRSRRIHRRVMEGLHRFEKLYGFKPGSPEDTGKKTPQSA